MAKVTITLTDTPEGSVAVESDYVTGVGMRCSLAQSAALDIIARTRKIFGINQQSTHPKPVFMSVISNSNFLRDTNDDRRFFPLSAKAVTKGKGCK